MTALGPPSKNHHDAAGVIPARPPAHRHAPPQSMTRYCESAARLGRWASAFSSRRSEGRLQPSHPTDIELLHRSRHSSEHKGATLFRNITTLLPEADSPAASGRLDRHSYEHKGGGRRRFPADGRRGVSSDLIPPTPSRSTSHRRHLLEVRSPWGELPERSGG